MSSIQTGIVLQDNFSNVAQGVVESMYNMTAAAYEAFYLNLCSAIFALIAIIISLLSDDVKNVAIGYMSDKVTIRFILYVAIVISVLYMVKSLVGGLINYCRKKYIFK